MQGKNYYEILQVENSAETETIHVAYKRLAKERQYTNSDLRDYIDEMQKLNKAYVVLCDPEKRADYNETKDENYSFSITYEDENLPEEDLEKQIPVEIDKESENQYQLKTESCSAYLEEQGRIKIIGEVSTTDGKDISEHLEIHCNVYDNTGKLVGTNHLLGKNFGCQQSFDWMVFFTPKSAIPVKIKIYFKDVMEEYREDFEKRWGEVKRRLSRLNNETE